MATTVQVTCLCKKNVEVLRLACPLPTPTSPCSCDTCRYTSGVLYFATIPLSAEPGIVDGLVKYNSSAKLTRYFCQTCGSPMFVETHDPQSWSVCSGVIDRIVDHETINQLEEVVQHEFVGDTKDGGVAICFAQGEGHLVPFFMNSPGGAKVEGSAQELLTELQRSATASIDKNPHMLSAGCHCGGVKFQITRPNASSRGCSSPWPDLVIPYHSSSSANPQDIKWWLREDDTKYLAGTCACRSCRLGSGSPIQTWAFIPKANILQMDDRTLDYDMGTLKQIESSPGCFREFCSRCGATVFWHCLERPDLVDVSVGLLRAPEGSRAVTWLDWWADRVSFREEAFDKQLIDQLEKGLHHIKQPSRNM